MRILFLTQWFQPEPFFKGMPFVKALQNRGHDVVFRGRGILDEWMDERSQRMGKDGG